MLPASVRSIIKPIIRYRNNRKLLLDAQPYFAAKEALNKPRSCIFFTTHKCASSFATQMLSLMCQSGAYEVCNHAKTIGYFSDDLGANGRFEEFLADTYDHLYRQRGYIYAPQRKPIDFPGRAKMRHIFFLRDPRDVVVSGYHSFAFTHKPPRQTAAKAAFETRRKEYQAMGLEAYAIQYCDIWVKPLLTEYRRLRETSESNFYVTYDEYLASPAAFMDRIAEYLDVSIDPKERDRIAKLAAPVASEIDNKSHKRSGRSGQFRTALAAETQAHLNHSLKSELNYWGFSEE
ncbi:MAG: sulfotransferase domain-containing protein [Pseudomonadota bacterium]